MGVSGTTYVAKIGKQAFDTVEQHGIEKIQVEDIFLGLAFPYNPFPKYSPEDLRPKKGS